MAATIHNRTVVTPKGITGLPARVGRVYSDTQQIGQIVQNSIHDIGGGAVISNESTKERIELEANVTNAERPLQIHYS